MTKITNGSSNHASRAYSPRSEDTTPAADTARTSATPGQSQGTQSTGTQAPQGTQATQAPRGTQATQAASPVQADYYRDSFTPAVASASATPTATPAVASASATPERVDAAGFMSSSSLGSGPTPMAQVGGVNGNGELREIDYDGGLIDGEGNVYPAGTPREGLTPTTPSNGQPASETIYYVNGIQTTAEDQAASMQHIADATGANVFGIHNSTYGKIWGTPDDLVQCLTDKLPGLEHLDSANPATPALAETILQDLEAGKPVHLMAHSQGALITSNALERVKAELTEAHGAERAEEMMSTIQVETYGGAATNFPYGPQYTHYINEYDMVPMQAGLGSIEDPAERQRAAGGDRAAIHFIQDDPRQSTPSRLFNISSHDFNQGYLAHRMPFEEALASNDAVSGQTSPVQGRDGAPVHYAAPAHSAAELAQREASQAAADSARAMTDAEVAMRSGDVAAAREAAARAAEFAGVAEEASARTPALVDAARQELEEAHTQALDERELVWQYSQQNLVPAPEGLPTMAEAHQKVTHLNEQLEDLNSAEEVAAEAAEQARENAERAAQIVRVLEQGLSPHEAIEEAIHIQDLRRLNWGG